MFFSKHETIDLCQDSVSVQMYAAVHASLWAPKHRDHVTDVWRGNVLQVLACRCLLHIEEKYCVSLKVVLLITLVSNGHFNLPMFGSHSEKNTVSREMLFNCL